MKRIIVFAFLLFTFHVYSQDRIARLTYSIVDTTGSETEQVKQIYDWLIHSIHADLRNPGREIKYYTPEQTLQRRKAIGYGYAELFRAICEELDIECYAVTGYAKDFSYVTGDDFFRSNHAWNVIFADSSVIFADAAWGSGGLVYDYKLWTKLRNTVSKNKGVKKRIRYIPFPNDFYFDIPGDSLIKTHFPLDARWQLKDYPISYQTFIQDTLTPPAYLNYKREIEAVRLQEAGYQAWRDAMNSLRYNPHNHFDIAWAWLAQGNQLKLSRHSVYDSLLLYQINGALAAYDSAQDYLRDYKVDARLFFKSKKQDEKSSYKQANRMIKNINKIPTTANTRYYRVYSRHERLGTMLHREEVEVSMDKLDLSAMEDFSYDSVAGYDTNRYTELTKKAGDLHSGIEPLMADLVDLNIRMEHIYAAGGNHNDTILDDVEGMDSLLILVNTYIDAMDEYRIFNSCDAVTASYPLYQTDLNAKILLREAIEHSYGKFQAVSRGAEQKLYSLLQVQERIARLTGDNALYNREADQTIGMIDSLYALKLRAIATLSRHNESWMQLYEEQNRILRKHGAGGITAINSKLTRYYDVTAERYEKRYAFEQKLYNYLRGNAKKRVKYLRATRTKVRDALKESRAAD